MINCLLKRFQKAIHTMLNTLKTIDICGKKLAP